jgi:hypothetical protein
LKSPSQFWGNSLQSTDQDVQRKKEKQKVEPQGLIDLSELESMEQVCDLTPSSDIFGQASLLGNESTNHRCDSDNDEQYYR